MSGESWRRSIQEVSHQTTKPATAVSRDAARNMRRSMSWTGWNASTVGSAAAMIQSAEGMRFAADRVSTPLDPIAMP